MYYYSQLTNGGGKGLGTPKSVSSFVFLILLLSISYSNLQFLLSTCMTARLSMLNGMLASFLLIFCEAPYRKHSQNPDTPGQLGCLYPAHRRPPQRNPEGWSNMNGPS